MKTERINLKNFVNLTKRAIRLVRNGKVIIFPTDTIPGLICDAGNKKAVDKIFKIKKRPKSKPLPVFVRDIKMAKELAEISKSQERFLEKNWPGKITVRLKRILRRDSGQGSLKLYGVDKNTIALRIPKYRYLNNLLEEINVPLAQTSVNISGRPVIINTKHALKIFKNRKDKPDLIIYAGRSKKSSPSKIFDLTSKKIKILR